MLIQYTAIRIHIHVRIQRRNITAEESLLRLGSVADINLFAAPMQGRELGEARWFCQLKQLSGISTRTGGTRYNTFRLDGQHLVR